MTHGRKNAQRQSQGHPEDESKYPEGGSPPETTFPSGSANRRRGEDDVRHPTALVLVRRAKVSLKDTLEDRRPRGVIAGRPRADIDQVLLPIRFVQVVAPHQEFLRLLGHVPAT